MNQSELSYLVARSFLFVRNCMRCDIKKFLIEFSQTFKHIQIPKHSHSFKIAAQFKMEYMHWWSDVRESFQRLIAYAKSSDWEKRRVHSFFEFGQ